MFKLKKKSVSKYIGFDLTLNFVMEELMHIALTVRAYWRMSASVMVA